MATLQVRWGPQLVAVVHAHWFRTQAELAEQWKSRTMVDRYVRTADAWRENAAAGLL